jgi:hypothetical protein
MPLSTTIPNSASPVASTAPAGPGTVNLLSGNLSLQGNRPVNCILPAPLEFPETRGTGFGRRDDRSAARRMAAGCGEGSALAADAARMAPKTGRLVDIWKLFRDS